MTSAQREGRGALSRTMSFWRAGPLQRSFPSALCLAVIIPAAGFPGQAAGSWCNVALSSRTLPWLTLGEEALPHRGRMTLVM